ncbi:MAG: SAM-dependent chlorinase/fluorinase [Planctomycetes bacterium]|uniref:SAM hydrolase/SAM-dependent halogenase family protein n=1 Tax=Candidatus Wunengus sp. YC65 TaxID=3367701 RepID=UPI001DA6DCE5|nr:SAM-dependent chlorinase/fluorinase [Planctomycetota bacterium]MBI5795374.1 SAM-dependent chlorinase/fluorinase [Planctomycetota bacterium]
MTVCRPRVITLLTDFGNQDAYVGIMKGVIAGINPFANIVDICHSIPPQDISTGAYLLYTSYKYFPKKTIHVAVVDPGVGSRRDIVCVETKDCFFLVPDNGLLSFIVQEERPKSIIRVTNSKYFLPSPSNTFHGRDVFAPIAAHLSLGVKPQQLGIKINQLEQLDIPKPVPKKAGQVEGQIIYIDRFGNLITNITKEYLIKGAGGQKPEVRSKKPDAFEKISKEKILSKCNIMETTIGKKRIVGLSKTYTDATPGEPLVLTGSAGLLEVSINQGNAQRYFKVEKGSKIIIEIGQSPF